MKILVFEDAQVADLYPISFGRPAMAITCGGTRLIDQLRQLNLPIVASVRPHLAALVAADFPDLTLAGDIQNAAMQISNSRNVLVVNARLAPSVEARKTLEKLIRDDRPCVARSSASILAAVAPASRVFPPRESSQDAIPDAIEALDLESIDGALPLFEFPHDVVRNHLTSLPAHLDEIVSGGAFREAADGVFLADGASLAEHVVLDTSKGPIVLERGASVGPFSFLSGPILIGRGARVIEHASVKDCVTLGHTTKVGGEVEASIIEPFSNKQHHGFIGHSYLGSWVNLGAGTCNSDLKNTYGEVNMQYGDRKVPTGMQFVGAFIGDYAKSAINTGIFTGKTVGVCSMLYGFVTTNVASFVNYARLFGQVTATPAEVMIAVQARMFARRNIPQRPCDIQLLRDMYQLTQHEREQGAMPLEPLSL